MRKFLLSIVGILWLSPAVAATGILGVSALTPRVFPNGVSIPTIANTDTAYPGCPAEPTTFGTTWFIDPVHGHTQAAGGLGTSAAPWDSLQAVFGSLAGGGDFAAPITGYTNVLLSTVPHMGPTGPILPGDKIVLMTGAYGKISGGQQFHPGSEIINSPAVTIIAGAGQSPVISTLALQEITGFVFDGFSIQSNQTPTDDEALVNINDGSVGIVNTNIIFNHMTIASDTVATANTWTKAQWLSTARPGFFIQGSNEGQFLTCVSVVNSHISVIRFPGSGALQIFSDNELVQNDEFDHFANTAIQYDASNVAIGLNYIHDVVPLGDFDEPSGIKGFSFIPELRSKNNLYIYRNKILDNIDPGVTFQGGLQAGLFTSNGDWTNVVDIDNLIAISGCFIIRPGNIHNGLVANNSGIDGGITSDEIGCTPQIVVARSDGGSTGPQGLVTSNVVIANNIAPTLGWGGANVQAFNNIATSVSRPQLSFSLDGGTIATSPNYTFSFLRGVVFEAPIFGQVTPGSDISGSGNIHDGTGSGNGTQFTAVPSPGSFPMSPVPNFTPISTAAASTAGAIVFIPPFTDFNGAPFTAPFARGGLSGTSLGSCAQSQAFFTRAAANIAAATTAGAPGITAWEGAVDGLICGQVTAGTWTLKDVEFMLVAPTVALANMNLVSSSFTLSPQATVTFAANSGMTGAANATGYADVTGYTPTSGQMTTSSALLGVCVINNRTSLITNTFISQLGTQAAAGGNSYVIDLLTGASTSSATLTDAGNSNAASFSSTTVPTTKGGTWVSRTSGSAYSSYNNGTNLGSTPSTGISAAGIGDFFVFSLNLSPGPIGGTALPDTAGAVILGAGETTAQVQADEALFTTALHSMGISSGC